MLECTISIRCDTILEHLEWLDPAKVELVPANGVILETVTAQFDKAVLAGIDREKPAVFELWMPEQIYILGFRTY